MNTIYWLTRLSLLHVICVSFMVILIISLIIGFWVYLIWCNDDYDEDYDRDVKKNKKYVKWLRNGIIGLIVCLSGTLFIPGKKDMLLIYGVGPIYDYVQDNDKVKQLPDKCIDYLDALVEMEKEELIEQKKNER